MQQLPLKQWQGTHQQVSADRNLLLGALVNLASSYVCLSWRQHGAPWLPLVRFGIWVFFFQKYVDKIKFSFRFCKNNAYFTWRPMHIDDNTSLSSSKPYINEVITTAAKKRRDRNSNHHTPLTEKPLPPTTRKSTTSKTLARGLDWVNIGVLSVYGALLRTHASLTKPFT